MTTQFIHSLCTSITCTAFSRPTAVFRIIEVECLCTLDRLRLVEGLGEEAVALRREAFFHLLEGLEVIEHTHSVLARAAQPFPTTRGTLDAIHLATVLMWKERAEGDLVMATKASGLSVVV